LKTPVTNLSTISLLADQRQDENEAFRHFLKRGDSDMIDASVMRLNTIISAQIDCTQCGNCCKSLMINVTATEAESLANHLHISSESLKKKYLEESMGGEMIISSIPCHFLDEKKCSIYQNRFEGCRDFPHLDKPGFTRRLFSIIMNYAVCPIIFNVIEALKEEIEFP
jgi:Fe-S-cluster containining protein